uniref:AIG1-type G domain-containing protein n=1 Tax=Laticauda laticaudata TaxID=8630 RepID=A0A8C5SME4_LATLA
PVSSEGREFLILLVDRIGIGKSATGNTIMGSEVFESGWTHRSATLACQKEEAQLKGRKVGMADTPGFDHISPPHEYTAAEVSKYVKFCPLGPHVILHVMDPSCSSQEMKMAQLIKEMFGCKAKDYTIIFDENLKEYIAKCKNRYLVFNNEAEGSEREAQVTELMTRIDDLVHRNRNAPCYTEDMMNFKGETTSRVEENCISPPQLAITPFPEGGCNSGQKWSPQRRTRPEKNVQEEDKKRKFCV